MQIPAPIISKLSQATNVLIIMSGANPDSLAASLALAGFLKKIEKQTELLSVSPKFQPLEFLTGFAAVRLDLDPVKSFVIDLSTKQTAIEELSYKKEDERLSIFIKPKRGSFGPEDVTFRSSSFPYDLLVLVGVDSLENLGEVYSRNTELFFETPILNIDFRATNESYGQLNLINLSATSNSEIVYDLISQFEAGLIDAPMATQLLSGIISETDSFQHVRTTPQTFLKASQLVSLGANQQEIISKLYKSKSLGLLKLWGRVLARLRQDPALPLVYSSITANDLAQAQASSSDAEQIIGQMIAQLGFAKLFLFLKEEMAGQCTGYFYSALPLDAKTMLKRFGPHLATADALKFTVPAPLEEAQQQVLEILRQEIAKYQVSL
jgi:phosphoesterase RecJ-like protein